MLNPDLKLNPHIFDTDVEKVPTRNGYGDGLLEAGKADDRVVALCADLTESTRTDAFAKEFPNRFVEIGVAEQNLAAVASGMAAMGKIPFFASYAMFSPGRNWEQIRTTICYNDMNCKIVGAHAGVSVGPDGGTHQAIEDIAITRVIPRMNVLYPCDSVEAKKATRASALDVVGPVYLRLAREKTPVITTEETPFEFGKVMEVWQSEKPDVALIATGPLLHNALVAAKELAEDGIQTVVLNVHTIKPLDIEKVIEVAERAGAVVTIEEHQILGGLGSYVAEVLAMRRPTPMEFIGVHDKFGQSGEPDQLIEYYGMGVGSIKHAVYKVKDRK